MPKNPLNNPSNIGQAARIEILNQLEGNEYSRAKQTAEANRKRFDEAMEVLQSTYIDYKDKKQRISKNFCKDLNGEFHQLAFIIRKLEGAQIPIPESLTICSTIIQAYYLAYNNQLEQPVEMSEAKFFKNEFKNAKKALTKFCDPLMVLKKIETPELAQFKEMFKKVAYLENFVKKDVELEKYIDNFKSQLTVAQAAAFETAKTEAITASTDPSQTQQYLSSYIRTVEDKIAEAYDEKDVEMQLQDSIYNTALTNAKDARYLVGDSIAAIQKVSAKIEGQRSTLRNGTVGWTPLFKSLGIGVSLIGGTYGVWALLAAAAFVPAPIIPVMLGISAVASSFIAQRHGPAWITSLFKIAGLIGFTALAFAVPSIALPLVASHLSAATLATVGTFVQAFYCITCVVSLYKTIRSAFQEVRVYSDIAGGTPKAEIKALQTQAKSDALRLATFVGEISGNQPNPQASTDELRKYIDEFKINLEPGQARISKREQILNDRISSLSNEVKEALAIAKAVQTLGNNVEDLATLQARLAALNTAVTTAEGALKTAQDIVAAANAANAANAAQPPASPQEIAAVAAAQTVLNTRQQELEQQQNLVNARRVLDNKKAENAVINITNVQDFADKIASLEVMKNQCDAIQSKTDKALKRDNLNDISAIRTDFNHIKKLITDANFVLSVPAPQPQR